MSIGDIVRRIRRELDDEPFEDYLIAAVSSASVATVSVHQPSAWAEFNILEFDDDTGEQVKVRTAGTNTLTVKRGHNDTNPTSHADTTAVLRNPRYGYGLVVSMMAEVVGDLWPYAWAVRELAITPSATETLFQLPPDFRDLITVSQKQTPTAAVSYAMYGRKGSGLPVGTIRGLGTADFGTGVALSFPNGFDNTTNTVNVRYRATLTTSDIEDGLMSNAVVYGTCSRLASGVDVGRLAKLDRDTPYGAGTRSAIWYDEMFKRTRWNLRNQQYRESAPARVYVR